MGQKVSPHALRLGVTKDWDSKWCVGKKEFSNYLIEDYKIRKFLKKKFYSAGVAKIGVERSRTGVRVYMYCSKPGMVIGKGGSGIESAKSQLERFVSSSLSINIVEVKHPDLNAQLAAENIASQLERRISFRRAIKQAIKRAIDDGAKGIKVQVSGRLGGAEIARAEGYKEGSTPLQTLRADIDYGFAEAHTTYGIIGVKAWICRGEILEKGMQRDDRTLRVGEKQERGGKNFKKDRR